MEKSRESDVPRPVAEMRTFAVVVPVYRTGLSDDERVSLRHLEHFLPDAEKFLMMPKSLDFGRDGYQTARFHPRFFRSLAGYNDLLLSKEFYSRFEAFSYILVHQLDAIILSSDIERFLAMGVDYLGAPWIEYDAQKSPYFTRVGNGGLSLRRVSAFRRLLESPVPHAASRAYDVRHSSRGAIGRRFIGVCNAGLVRLGLRDSVRSALWRPFGAEDWFIAAEAKRFSPGGAEDWFIAAEAAEYCPGFTVGSIDQGLEFAFEREPRFCFAKTGGRLPLGAHAWNRYDRAFWEPHLLS